MHIITGDRRGYPMSDVAQLHDHAFPFPELMPIDHAAVQATAIRHDTIPVAMDRRADQEHEGVGYPRPDKVAGKRLLYDQL